jgi:hypothetical protein
MTAPTGTAGLSHTIHSGTPVYSFTRVISEAQVVYAHVVPVDNHGNRREQAQGPVYVDSPYTPDIIALGQGGTPTYHGWMDSGCSLMGVDRRVESHAFDGASLSEEQRFYTTWNGDALRMAWEGANWNYEGDLFVYFDTTPGGATTLYNPYTATMTDTTIYLPGNLPPVDTSTWPEFEEVRYTQLITSLLSQAMQADYLLWVDDATATLMSWNGSAWTTDRTLDGESYQRNDGITDFYLPFSWLGIGDPTAASLNLLAVASEEDALRLWATMPDRNLVDSSRAVNPLGAVAPEHVFVLSRAYRWISLGSGLCPNDPLESLTGMRYVDSDLRAEIVAAPVGTAYSLNRDDLFAQWRGLFQGEDPQSRQFTFVDHNHPPLNHGDTVTYTLRVINRGTSPATDVQAFVAAHHALSLDGGTQVPAHYSEYRVLDVGTVAPNAVTTTTFTGEIDVATSWRYNRCVNVDGLPEETCRRLLSWATLDAMLFDARSPLTPTIPGVVPLLPPVEWMWVDHEIDLAPPQRVGIEDSRATVRPSIVEVRGYASDPSGVSTIELQVRDSLSATTVITCPDAAPHDGRWTCEWVASGDDGDEFDLRVRATDGCGHTSAWTSPWRTVVLDSTPPTVTLDSEARAAVDGQLIGRAGYLLTGVFTDSHSQGNVQACRDTADGTTCAPSTVILSTQAPTDTARLYDDVPGTAVAIGATCLTRTFTVTDSFFAADVDVGFAASISNREELVLDLFSPLGTSARLIASVLSDTMYANYDVWLDDSAPGVLHNSADDDPTAPYFDRATHPDAVLSVFNGEPVSGTWTLRVCDVLPLVNQGDYHRARLSLTPQSNALSSVGEWAYGLPTPAGMDSVTQTLAMYGLDSLGNRVSSPINLTYLLDTVAPVLTATQVANRMTPKPTKPMLIGQVSDGGEMEGVYVRVDPPDGASYRDVVTLGDWHRVYLPLVTRGTISLQSRHWMDHLELTSSSANDEGSAENWYYIPRSQDEPGTYTYWLEAYDQAGNVTVRGPYELQVSRRIYLPLMVRD